MSNKILKKSENDTFLTRLFLDALNKVGAANKSEGLKSFLLHVAPRIFRLVTGIIGGAVVTRHLGPENFGVFAFANMVAAWAEVRPVEREKTERTARGVLTPRVMDRPSAPLH
jgi:hypothetical protein